MVRLSNANFINNYPQPVFHFNESQLRCVKVIVTQTLQRRPLAAHASKFRVSGNTHLSLRYSSIPANVFRGSSCVPARGTREPLRDLKENYNSNLPVYTEFLNTWNLSGYVGLCTREDVLSISEKKWLQYFQTLHSNESLNPAHFRIN